MKILTVVGARPQFIKACMLSKIIVQEPDLQEIIVHTGQHYDVNMSDIFFNELKLPVPDYHLKIGSGSHGKQTSKMLCKLEEIMVEEKPDIVLVYGDTNSTLAGSLSAAKLNIPIAHVESGLRSYNKKMPEEINRVVTDHLSTLFFCPTQTAVNNLKKEGINHGVYLTGDINYDALLFYKSYALNHSTILSDLNLTKEEYYLATIHRAENTDNYHRLKTILEAFNELDMKVIFPIHPRTKEKIKQMNLLNLLHSSNIKTIEPLPYFDMIHIENFAKAILTDSGGVQKEAYMLRVPCITLRDETEWTETVDSKWNTLVGASNLGNISHAIANVKKPSNYPAIFGDGHSSKIMTNILLNFK
ncbi:non-hydrolyzing UDP-N-acetylglucosamine 2-epimerase [Metabacillus halosaccharovorans]|uniref:non-hydrolyzing UDP-N-acetylglucosamine 2-epimerase n=1 Tax=Metabacillus halosaccharovorans TaxID=930124 RepID=UPI000995378C|nr:UDP-N-acetylglucosamine 2-epimerase (non-hydrolyzing) [Metabacillus halosaccharovorans]